jgi:hypothetical protein
VRADSAKKDVAICNLLAQVLHEIGPHWHVIDIEEKVFLAKPFRQPVVEASRRTSRIVAAIADKDLTRHSPSQGFYNKHFNPTRVNSLRFFLNWRGLALGRSDLSHTG